MGNQRYGLFDFYYPGTFWNFRRFTDRRLKTLHVIGFYNAAILAFLTVGRDSLHADNPILAASICTVSFCIALIGFAVEIPGLSHYFEKLGAIIRKEDRFGRQPRGYRSKMILGSRLPVHISGVAFYVLLMLLWGCIFCLTLSNLNTL